MKLSALTILCLLLVSCSQEKKTDITTPVKVTQDIDDKSFHELALQNNATLVDNLFENDSSAYAYSYQIEKRLIQSKKKLLAKIAVGDIVSLSDSAYLIQGFITFKKAAKKIGMLNLELKCTKQVVDKIEKLRGNELSLQFLALLDVESVRTVLYQVDHELDKTVDETEDEPAEYDVALSISFSPEHRGKGRCYDIFPLPSRN